MIIIYRMYILKSCTRQQLNTICTIDVQKTQWRVIPTKLLTMHKSELGTQHAQNRSRLTRWSNHARHRKGVNISYKTLQSRITKIKKIHNRQNTNYNNHNSNNSNATQYIQIFQIDEVYKYRYIYILVLGYPTTATKMCGSAPSQNLKILNFPENLKW